MKRISYFLILYLAVMASSCSTVALQSKIQRITVGMDKQQVINTVGKQYEVVHSMMTPEGGINEIWEYSDLMYGDRYEFEFYDGLLVRYTKLAEKPEPENHPHDRHRNRR